LFVIIVHKKYTIRATNRASFIMATVKLNDSRRRSNVYTDEIIKQRRLLLLFNKTKTKNEKKNVDGENIKDDFRKLRKCGKIFLKKGKISIFDKSFI